jgi:multiple sugar transport system permease protein
LSLTATFNTTIASLRVEPSRRLSQLILRGRFLWVAPLVAALTITTVYPGIFLIALAVSDSRLGKPFSAFSGFKNLGASLSDPLFLEALGRSAAYAVASSLVQLALGLAIALLLSALVKSGRFLMSLILLPLMTPPVMVGIAWKLILAPAGGLLNGVLMNLGITDAPISFLGTAGLAWLSVGVADVWQWTPFIAILSFAAIASLPGDVFEAAAIDGASAWQTFRKILLPLLAPQLAAIFLLRLVIAFKIFDLIYVLTFGGPGLPHHDGELPQVAPRPGAIRCRPCRGGDRDLHPGGRHRDLAGGLARQARGQGGGGRCIVQPRSSPKFWPRPSPSASSLCRSPS